MSTRINTVMTKTYNFSRELPDDIMLLILPRLYLSDYFRCRAVCRSWLATIDRALASKSCLPSSQLPCLMFRSAAGEEDHCFLSLSENQKVYKYSNPTYDMKNLYCVGSIEGWLIMVYNHGRTVTNFFLNTISGAKVMLPSQTTICCSKDDENKQASFFSRVIASSPPTNPNSCLVAAIYSQSGLAFCRPTDKSWTRILYYEQLMYYWPHYHQVHDIEIIDGNIYAITSCGKTNLDVINIHLDEDGPHHTYKAERRYMTNVPDHSSSCIQGLQRKLDRMFNETQSDLRVYLFKDSASNELFMIYVLVSCPNEAKDWYVSFPVDDCNFVVPPEAMFQVYKLQNDIRWVEVLDIGKRILLLSKTTRLLVPIRDHDKKDTNCIYFAFGRLKRDFLGQFSLTDNSIKYHTTASENPSPGRRTPPAWFTPSI